MSSENRIDPGHGVIRAFLGVVGPLIIIVGGGFTAVGLISFFSSFGAIGAAVNTGSTPHSPFPDKFWCAFVGLPLLALGIGITKAAYMGRIARYVSGEITPVATDTLNYVADETQESVEDVTAAISRGLSRGDATRQDEDAVRCPSCEKLNDADARFCKSCGVALARSCLHCGEANVADARFCDRCGKTL